MANGKTVKSAADNRKRIIVPISGKIQGNSLICKKNHGDNKARFFRRYFITYAKNFRRTDINMDKDIKRGKIGFTGDFLCYEDTLNMHKTTDGFDFGGIFDGIKSLSKESDHIVANLEMPVAGEESKYVYERYRFNTPIDYIEELKRCGADIFTLANNHCMDRGEKGLVRTVGNIRAIGGVTLGVNLTEKERDDIYVTDIGGTKVSLINYTYGTNAFSHKTFLSEGHKFMVNLTQPEETLDGAIHLLQSADDIERLTKEYYEESGEIYKTVLKPYLDRIAEDIAKAKKKSDVVIFALHSGGQYNALPEAYTEMLMNFIYGAGADLIVGNHPHIIQPCTYRSDGKPNIYCLGNTFYSLSYALNNRTECPVDKTYSIMLYVYLKDGKIDEVTFSLLKLVLAEDNEKTVVEDVYKLVKDGKAEESEVLRVANYFTGFEKFTTLQKEYSLKKF